MDMDGRPCLPRSWKEALLWTVWTFRTAHTRQALFHQAVGMAADLCFSSRSVTVRDWFGGR